MSAKKRKSKLPTAERARLAKERDAVRKNCRKSSTNKMYHRHQRDYKANCLAMGYEAWPPTYESVSAFLYMHVKRGNSANSFSTMVAALKAGAREAAMKNPRIKKSKYWLSSFDQETLSEWRTGARKLYGKPPRRRPPLTTELLEKMALVANLDDAQEEQYLTVAWVKHDALLRHREVAYLDVDSVYWDGTDQTCQLTIIDSKCNQGRFQEPEIVHLIPYGQVSGYGLLRRLWNSRQMAERAAGALVFSSAGRGLAKPGYMQWMRRVLAQAGVPNAGEYTGHSCRAGGATDLFNAGVPARLIQLAGRWKSVAYLIYIRDHPKERAQAVANAFAKLVSTAA